MKLNTKIVAQENQEKTSSTNKIARKSHQHMHSLWLTSVTMLTIASVFLRYYVVSGKKLHEITNIFKN